jgi:hypothetical protein
LQVRLLPGANKKSKVIIFIQDMSNKNILIIIGIVVIAILGILILGLNLKTKSLRQPVISQPTVQTTTLQLPEIKEKQETKETETKIKEQKLEKIDTSDWAIYSNKEYGFEFKHPKDYKISSDSKIDNKLVFIFPRGDFEFSVRIDKNLNNFRLGPDPIGDEEVYFDYKDKNFKIKRYNGSVEVFRQWCYEMEVTESSDLQPLCQTKNGEDIYFFSYGDVGAFAYKFFIPNYKKNYMVIFEYGSDWNEIEISGLIREFEEFERNFNQILYTFRFLE